MITVSLETTPEIYDDYKTGLDLLRAAEEDRYEYPEEVTLFHVYTEVRTPKELMAIKSYLATQNLKKTKLIVWSDYDISDQENIQPYKDVVDFRVYNPTELAQGTPLEGVKSHLKTGGDRNHWMSSGVMRFLVLYKFGGIYFDMDMILLRDFKPILSQDFAYQWGSSKDFAKERRGEEDCHGPCAAMLGAVKGSPFIEDCMERLVQTPPTGGTCYDEDMLSYVYAKRPFTVFPSTFFNTEWLISKTDPELSKALDVQWFDAPLEDFNNLFLEAFAWHWHNSSNRNKDVVKGSKFDMLDTLMTARLRERNII
jgi:hypothetical protein